MFRSVFDGVEFLWYSWVALRVRAKHGPGKGERSTLPSFTHTSSPLRPSTVIHLDALVTFQILVRSVGPKRGSPTLVRFLLLVAGHGPLFGAVPGLFVLLLA